MLHYNSVQLYKDLGDRQAAVMSYKKALQLDRTHLDSLENLIFHLQLLGKDDEAVQFVRHFVQRNPTSRAQRVLAKALEGAVHSLSTSKHCSYPLPMTL